VFDCHVIGNHIGPSNVSDRVNHFRFPVSGGTGVDRKDVTPMHDDTETSWMASGNCRSYPPAVFFPSDGVGVDRARRICATCPVSTNCLEYALENRIDHGVWGGASERERRRILKRRRLALVVR